MKIWLFSCLLIYKYVHYVIFLPMVMHMHIKLLNTFENWHVMYILLLCLQTSLYSDWSIFHVICTSIHNVV